MRLIIYTDLGQTVRLLVSQFQATGDYKIYWDGKDENGSSVSSGIYVYRIDEADCSERRTMLLIKELPIYFN